MLKRFAVIVSGAALCVGFGAPSLYAQSGRSQADTRVAVQDGAAATAQQGTQAVSDASITTAVKTRLMKDKAARASDIDVDTDDGVVTISGKVPTAADKTRIAGLVRRTTGVKRVENKLTVSPASGAAGTSGSDDTKIIIKDDTPDIKIKDETNVKIKDDTTPKVKKGAKAVKGAAEATGSAIADAAKKTAGVATDVGKKTADVTTDASVATAVKTRLMKDDVARSTAIDVSADDGVVTISGTVPTAADKARIGKLVADTTGVKRVVNKLTVQ
jgi:osmotically-inducible protein OsmY